MRCHHDWIGADAVVRRNDIAYRVRRRLETKPRQLLRKRARTVRLLKRWRGYCGQSDLIAFNVWFAFRDKMKCPLDACIANYGVDSRAHYLTSKLTGSDSIGGCVARLAVTRY